MSVSSEDEVQGVAADLHPGGQDLPMLGRIHRQDGVRIVDVNIDLPPYPQRRNLLQGSGRAADGKMPHLGSTERPDPQSDEFLLIPERSIQEKRITVLHRS